MRSRHLENQDRSAGSRVRFRESLMADWEVDHTKDCTCRLTQACPHIQCSVDLDTTTARGKTILVHTAVPVLGAHLRMEAAMRDRGSLNLEARTVADPARPGSQA